jgi:hypothetical protein
MTYLLLLMLSMTGPVTLEWDTYEDVVVACPAPPAPPNPYEFNNSSTYPQMYVIAVYVPPCVKVDTNHRTKTFKNAAAAFKFISASPRKPTPCSACAYGYHLDRYVVFTKVYAQ